MEIKEVKEGKKARQILLQRFVQLQQKTLKKNYIFEPAYFRMMMLRQ